MEPAGYGIEYTIFALTIMAGRGRKIDGMVGLVPMAWGDLVDFQKATRIKLSPWLLERIMDFDKVILKHFHLSKQNQTAAEPSAGETGNPKRLAGPKRPRRSVRWQR